VRRITLILITIAITIVMLSGCSSVHIKKSAKDVNDVNSSSPNMLPNSAKKITLTVVDSDPHDIFLWIANQMSLSLSIYHSPSLDLALSHPTSLEAKRVRANDLLDDLCYNYHCKWSIENKTLVIKGMEN